MTRVTHGVFVNVPLTVRPTLELLEVIDRDLGLDTLEEAERLRVRGQVIKRVEIYEVAHTIQNHAPTTTELKANILKLAKHAAALRKLLNQHLMTLMLNSSERFRDAYHPKFTPKLLDALDALSVGSEGVETYLTDLPKPKEADEALRMFVYMMARVYQGQGREPKRPTFNGHYHKGDFLDFCDHSLDLIANRISRERLANNMLRHPLFN